MITEVKFTEEDIDLLKKDFPDNPCKLCGINSGICGGCERYSTYIDEVKPYKDNGILQFAEIISELKRNSKQIHSIRKENNSLIKKNTTPT